MEGISTYHVNEEGFIWKHVLDNKEVDPEAKAKKEATKPLDKIKEKLEKLKEGGGSQVPAPSM